MIPAIGASGSTSSSAAASNTGAFQVTDNSVQGFSKTTVLVAGAVLVGTLVLLYFIFGQRRRK